MTLDLINFVPNTKIKSSDVNNNFNQIAEDLSLTQGTVEQLNSMVTVGVVPTGSVFYFAGSSVPDGYLLCDGSAVSRSTYATLYTKIGTTYGSGDGSTTFNLPNLTDERYIQGNTIPGTTLAAQLPDHIHGFSATTEEAGGHSHSFTARNSGGATYPIEGSVLENVGASYTDAVGNHTHDINTRTGLVYNNNFYVYNGGVRPKSLTLLPCIKY